VVTIDQIETADVATGAIDDGLSNIKSTLIGLFTDTAKLHVDAKVAFSQALGNKTKELYVDLVGRAVSASGVLYAVHKLNQWRGSNEPLAATAIRASVTQPPEEIAENALKIQSSLISSLDEIKTFYNSLIAMFESDTSVGAVDSLAFASDFLDGAIDAVALNTTSGDTNILESALAIVAALYDEYLQDLTVSNFTASAPAPTPVVDNGIVAPAPVVA
jgi:hypothetical protein